MKSQTRPSTRLALVGTRVVVLRAGSQGRGVIAEVRQEPFLKSYVVAMDDQTIVYCSQHDVALEADETRTPLAPALEY